MADRNGKRGRCDRGRGGLSWGVAAAVLAALTLGAVVGAVAARDPEDGGPAGAPDTAADIDTAYVQEHLEEHLKPTAIDFLGDGRVRLYFNFEGKDLRQSESFLPAISSDPRKTFRWTQPSEEGSDLYRSYSYDRKRFTGLRLGNGGVALLKCWFRDDVEVEVEYAQLRTYTPRQLLAVAFYTEKHKALGSNFGDQCVLLKKNVAGTTKGTVEPPVVDQEQSFRLVLRKGTSEAYRNGRLRQRMAYRSEEFASGRAGLLWNGGIAGVVLRLRVEGTLDTARIAKELRERRAR